MLSDELDEVPSETLAVEARNVIDKLRSVQLYAENRAYQETINALRETIDNVNKLATQLSGAYLRQFSIGKKTQRQWRMSKYAWYAVIASVVMFGLIVLVRMFTG